MKLEQIKNWEEEPERVDSLALALRTWAQGKNYIISERPEQKAFAISLNDWAVEIIPQNGWAYVHGEGAYNGISTNIESLDDLDEALERIRAASTA